MKLTLDSPILEIDPRLAKRRAGSRSKDPLEAHEVLERMGVRTVGDLLHHYPRRYIDRSRVETIRDLKAGAYATVIASVRKVAKRQTRRHQTMVTVTLYDKTGLLDLTFFNQPWLASLYKEGQELAVSGVVTLYRGRTQLANQEVELLRGDDADLIHTARITPVHPASEGITTRTIRELVYAALEQLPKIPDPLPAELVEAESLSDYDQALRKIHFPEHPGQLARAQERLKFDELFTLELGVAFRKHRVEVEQTGVAHAAAGPLTERLGRTLPFEPTGAQERAIRAVDEAMERPRPMNVLLQGDVGAGKTLVALHAALVAIQSGHQAAIMAPTEVLAGQHLRSVAVAARGRRRRLVPRSGARGGQGRRAGLAARSRAREPAGRIRDVRAADRGGHREGPRARRAGDRGRRGGPDDRHARPGAGGGVVPRPVARGRGRAASLRPASADGPEGQGRRARRHDHDGDPDPADPGAHLLRRPRRDRARRDAEGPPADRDARRPHPGGARTCLRPGARRRSVPAGRVSWSARRSTRGTDRR